MKSKKSQSFKEYSVENVDAGGDCDEFSLHEHFSDKSEHGSNQGEFNQL